MLKTNNLSIYSNKILSSNNMIIYTIRKKWEDIVGTLMTELTFPYFLKDKKLYILVEGNIIIQEIKFAEKDIIDKINSFFDEEKVDEIFYKNDKIKKRENFKKEKKEQKQFVYKEQEEIDEKIKKEFLKIEENEITKKYYEVSKKIMSFKEFLKKEYNYKECIICGNLTKKESSICVSCETKKEQEERSKIINEIKKDPLITYNEMKEKYNITEQQFFHSRDILADDEIEKIKDSMRFRNEELIKKHLEMYSIYKIGTSEKEILEIEQKKIKMKIQKYFFDKRGKKV